jgi:hypothetical protein
MLGLVAKGTLSPYNETIQEILQETEAVREGEQKSLRSLRAALDRELFMRGRVWRDVRPAKRPTEPNEKGEFELMVDMASEQHQLTDKMVLYLFEEKLAQDGGRYLGEFRVSGVGGKQVTLNPAKKMDQEEYNRLVKSSGPWVIYERLPMDRHDLFEGLSEQDLKAMMPSAYQEILRHGQPAKADDPPECVVDGKYQRPLIDFALALNHAHIRRSQLIDLKKAAERDKEMIDKALAVAQAQQKVYEQQKEEAEKALKQMEAERNAAAAHLKEVEERTRAALQADAVR